MTNRYLFHLVLAVTLAYASPTHHVSAEAPADEATRLIQDISALGVKKVGIITLKDALKQEQKEALLEKAPAKGLTLLIKEVDLGEAEKLAAEIAKVQEAEVEAVMPLGDSGAVNAILQQMRNLAFSQPALLYKTGEDGTQKLSKESVMPVFDTVLEIKRPTSTDVIFMKGGDKLTGTVMNESISMRTSYAPQIKFETRLIAGILFEGEAYMETVFTVNANRFSGFIDDTGIIFKLAQGPKITIRKEKMKKIIFHTRQNELGGIQRNNLIQLNNGDVLTGVILNKSFPVKTTYAEIPVEANTISHISMIGGENVLTKIKLRGSDDVVQGILTAEDIEVDLDTGPEVKIYQDRIKEVSFQRGYAEAFDLSALGMSAAGLLGGAKKVKNSIGMELILIPAGKLSMGSNNGSDDEKPLHEVKITKPFYLGATEVTQAQYQAAMGTNPSEFTGDPNRPVEKVSWDEAVAFCKRLSEKEKVTYRLPTEAEWEYACRAGSESKYCFGDNEGQLGDYAWYDSNSGKRTQPVGQKKANAWGLFDMHGNVYEWCADRYGSYASSAATDPTGAASGSYRVYRGGGWSNSAGYLRSADRFWDTPSRRSSDLGFRVARPR